MDGTPGSMGGGGWGQDLEGEEGSGWTSKRRDGGPWLPNPQTLTQVRLQKVMRVWTLGVTPASTDSDALISCVITGPVLTNLYCWFWVFVV